MQTINIENFGKIKNLNLEIKDLTVLTGEQTSGKSTVAKCIYFFKTLPNEILDFLLNNYKKNRPPEIVEIENYLIKRFHNFWIRHYYSSNTKMEFIYFDSFHVHIKFSNPNNPILSFGVNIKQKLGTFLNSIDFNNYDMQKITNHEKLSIDFISELNKIFNTEHDDVVYIPAGRSVILKTEQKDTGNYNFNDLFLSLFLKRINENIEFIRKGFSAENTNDTLSKLISDLLKAEIVLDDNNIFLEVEKNKKFSLSELSSGQSEVLWLVSLLKQFMNENQSRYIFIEEPETNLYPTSQKDIVMLIAMFLNSNSKHQILITTHSPYVLSVFSNLFLAKSKFDDEEIKDKEKIDQIISRNFWLNIKNATALMFTPKQSEPEDCIDETEAFIKMGSVDAVAEEINNVFYKLQEIN